MEDTGTSAGVDYGGWPSRARPAAHHAEPSPHRWPLGAQDAEPSPPEPFTNGGGATSDWRCVTKTLRYTGFCATGPASTLSPVGHRYERWRGLRRMAFARTPCCAPRRAKPTPVAFARTPAAHQAEPSPHRWPLGAQAGPVAGIEARGFNDPCARRLAWPRASRHEASPMASRHEASPMT